MIYVLHGDDIKSSYGRLTQIMEQFPPASRVRLTPQSSQEDFYLAVHTRDIFETDKITVCEKFLTSKILKEKDLNKIPKESIVIFWEQNVLTPTQQLKLKKIARIEEFKTKPRIFYFLDSLSPDVKKSLTFLFSLDDVQKEYLPWQLATRILLLILIRLNIERQRAQEILGKRLEDWQWQKITRQADKFKLETLKALFAGMLKIDLMIKTGSTSLSEENLLTLLFLKYLKD